MKEIRHLLKTEVLLEMRQPHVLSGITVYVLSTIFVCFLAFNRIIDTSTWNALFWIILLFASVNAAVKSFYFESKGRHMYMYPLSSPQGIILSKMLYNSLLLLLLGGLCLAAYLLLVGNVVQDMLLFLAVLLLGCTGFAAVFTMISAIASKTDNAAALMAVLGFPVILPMLITLIKLSKNAIEGLGRNWEVAGKYMLVLLLLNAVVVALGYLLFPYLWRD